MKRVKRTVKLRREVRSSTFTKPCYDSPQCEGLVLDMVPDIGFDYMSAIELDEILNNGLVRLVKAMVQEDLVLSIVDDTYDGVYTTIYSPKFVRDYKP